MSDRTSAPDLTLHDRRQIQDLQNAIIRAVPDPHHLRFLPSSPDEVRFEWRGTSYRVSAWGSVDEIGDGVLVRSDRAELMRVLIARADR